MMKLINKKLLQMNYYLGTNLSNNSFVALMVVLFGGTFGLICLYIYTMFFLISLH